MSGNSRKRSSKWDVREEPESKQLRPSWSSRDSQRHNGSKWSYMEEADKMSPENDMELSSKENYHGSRGSRKDDIINKDSRRVADASMAWDRDSSYGARMSRGLVERRHGSRSQSPKNNWHRSVRSRSRSRSAERGYRRDMGARDRTRSRSGATAQTCRDFDAGNCRRGSHCHFLHEGDKNYDDNRETRHRIDGASRYVHHSISDGCSQGITDELSREREFDRRSIENSFEQVRQEPGRSIDTPCKFFAAGHCRNGKYCRFSHNEQAFASPRERSKDKRRGYDRSDGEQVWDHPRRSETSSPKRGLRDDKCELYHDIVDVNKVWNGPTWDDVGAGSKTAKMDTSKSVDERQGYGRSDGKQAWDHPRRSETSSPKRGLRDDKRELYHDILDVNKVWNGPTWDDIGVGSKTVKIDTNKSMDPPKSGSTSWPVNDQLDHKLEGNIKVISEHTTKSGKEESNRWEMQKAGVSMNLTDAHGADKWISDVDMSPDWHYQMESSKFVAKEEHGQSKSNLPGEVTYRASHNHDRADTLPGQGFGEDRQFHAPDMHAIDKNKAMVPNIPSTGNYLEGPYLKLGYADTQGSIQPNVGKAIPLQVNSTIPSTQNTVSSGQFSQLIHLLGKGQQLPQLYATLDSHDSKTANSFGNIEGPYEPAASNTIEPNPTTGMQNQHDPVCNRIETKNTDAIVVPSTFSQNSVGQKEVFVEKLERSSLMPISDKVDDPCNVGNSDARKSQLVKQCETTTENNVAVVDGLKTVLDDNRRAKKNVTSENMERDGDTDEDKKIKDAKVIRAFKFALVEFVKELLKPTWKEGKITKEGYKTIVKKVVDKVTGSLQANHIPQTQEKIDQYFSFSKAKLNKLVQAYVEKVQKA